MRFFALDVMLSVALYYLFARAQITSFLWSHYPKWLDDMAWCAACSGAWIGFVVGALGAWQKWPFLGLPGRNVLTVILIGLCSMVWTPIVADLQLGALARTGAGSGDGKPGGADGQEK